LTLVLLACLAVYLPTTTNGFVMDDEYIVKVEVPGGKVNRMVESWQGLDAYFTTPYWSVAANPDRLYRPVSVLSYALVSQQLQSLFSSETVPQHWVNVLLNVWAVLLVFLLLKALHLQPGVALIGALIFGMNALHSEAVANVIGRAEILAFCFAAAGSLSFLRSGAGDLISRVGYLLLSAFLMFLAFCSKESALAWMGFLPVLILARSWREDPSHDPARIARHHLLPLLAVLVVPCLVYFWLRGIALSSVEPVHSVDYVANPLFYATWDQRLLTAVMLWGYGLGKMLIPMHLSSDYGAEVFRTVTSPTHGGFLIAALVLGACLILGLRKPRRQPLLFAATACFFGFSFITSNIPFATGVNFAERLYYTPSLALCLVFAWGWESIAPRWRRVLSWGTVLWITFGALRIWNRNPDWKDTVTLAMHDVEGEPHSIRLAMITAQRLGQEASADPKNLEKAREILLAINEIQPEVPRVSQALGAIALRQAKKARRPGLRQQYFLLAEKYFMQGISSIYFNPRTQGAELRSDLSEALKGQGRISEALEQLDRSLDLSPGNLQRLKEMFDYKLPETILRKYVNQALQYQPREPWDRPKGLLAKAEGRYADAAGFLKGYLQRDPRDWETRFDLSDCLSVLGQKEAAIAELKRITDDPRMPAEVRARARAKTEEVRRQ